MRAWLVCLVACQSGASVSGDKKVTNLSPDEMVALCHAQEARHRETFTREEQNKIYCAEHAYAEVTDAVSVDQQRGVCDRAYRACLSHPPPEVANAGTFKCNDFEWVKKLFTCGNATVDETEDCWREQDLRARRVVVVDPCGELQLDGKTRGYARFVARFEGPRCAALDAACAAKSAP